MGIAERKEREKEQRRNEIIKAAEKVFFEKGIKGATMDDVADTAELSKGTLYLYFNNKEDLYYAICIKGLSVLNEYFLKSVSPEKTSFENLFEIGKAYIRFAREHADYFHVMTHFDAMDYDFGESSVENPHLDDVMPFFIEIIEKGQKDGSVTTDLPAPLMAHLLWTQTTGVLRMMSAKKLHIESYDIKEEDMILGHFRIIVDGINANPEPVSLNLEL